MIPIRRGVILPFIAVLGVSCSSSSSTSPATTSTPLIVFAASSLTKAFTQIGQDFDTAHPNVTVTFDFGSSTDLASQIQSEGTADVFASASGTAMDTLQSAPGVPERTSFATHPLAVVTGSTHPDAATAFLDYVVEPAGQATLKDFGFGPAG